MKPLVSIIMNCKNGEEFFYIWNVKEKKWYYRAEYGSPQRWTELR